MGVNVAAMEAPSEDEVCPVCFGEFVLPCRANCGHWFCGSCILHVWKFMGNAFQACKCPMCNSDIISLKPNVSLNAHDEGEAMKVLKSIERYNQRFVGGVWGFVLKLYDGFPHLLRRMCHQMTDPDQVHRHLHWWRIIALILAASYMISPFKFIPEGIDVIVLCNLAAPVVVILIQIAGWFQKRRATERVRLLAAAEAPMERG